MYKAEMVYNRNDARKFFIKGENCYFRLTDFQHLLVDGCFDFCYNQGTIKQKEL